MILSYMYNATFGMLGVYITMCVSLGYLQQKKTMSASNYGSVLTSVICFCIFSGFVSTDTFDFGGLGAKGMFTGVLCALLASFLYDWFYKKFGRLVHFYADGAFHTMLSSILPMATVTAIFALINLAFAKIFHVSGFLMLFSNILNGLFETFGRSYLTAFIFSCVSNILWFLGIHGNDVLEAANQEIFVTALEMNQNLLNQGLPATEIYSKTFMDVFVNMGGCGTAWCLILAILLFSKRKSNRGLAKIACIPGILNVSEIVIFGLPVVFNPVFFIPFLITPIVMLTTSALAVYAGLVPVTVHAVEWTTPIILGGYMATGSVAGAVLQVVNLVIGIFIYRPFVKLFDRDCVRNAALKMDKLVDVLKVSEESRRPVELISLRDDSGNVARMLAEELREQMREQKLQIYYQPQFNEREECIGAEALLRWKHPIYGMVYPPLIVKLADETNRLLELEKAVFRSVVADMDRMLGAIGEHAKVSLNVTGITIQSDDFEYFLKQMKEKYPAQCEHIMIEITEQAALQINDSLIERFTRIKDIGYKLAIDDFSMGSTSIKYLQTNIFSLVKLDGALSKGVMNNQRSRDIIASITKLSHDFGIKVLAEYVETEEQRQILENAQCHLYQGYLYSPAITLEALEEKKFKAAP